MGITTFGQGIEEVRRECGNREELTADRVRQLLVYSMLHLASPDVFRHQELFIPENVTLVAGVNQVAIGVSGYTGRTVHYVEGVRNSTSDYGLIPKDKRWLRERRRATSGRPQYYIHANLGEIHYLDLYPTPDAQYGVDILIVETYATPRTDAIYTNDATEFQLSSEWDEVIVKGGVWRAWNWLGQKAMAEAALADLVGLINDKKERHYFEAEADPREVEISMPMSTQRFTR